MELVKYSKRWEEINYQDADISDTVHCRLVLETDGKDANNSVAIAYINECIYPSRAKDTDTVEEVPCYFGRIRLKDEWKAARFGYIRCDETTLDAMKNRMEDEILTVYAVEYINAKNNFLKFKEEWEKISAAFDDESKDDANGTMD